MAVNNTLIRIAVSVIAIPFILALCYYGGMPFLIFVLLVALLAHYEINTMFYNKNIFPSYLLGAASVILIITNIFFDFFEQYDVLLIILLLHSLTELFKNKGSAIINLGASFLSILYLGFFAGSLIKIREFYPSGNNEYYIGGYIIISLIVSIWFCDTAAYFLGLKFGRHKIFPRVSPKKSWEGAIFGFFASIIAMILAKIIILDSFSWSLIITLGVAVGIAGQLGDFVESLFKRDANVKDSSNLIPGHGGIFDRFDSLIFSAPVVYLILKLFFNK